MRKLNRVFVYTLAFIGSQIAFGQSGPSVSGALDFWITNTETEVVGAAEAMPEEKYNFAPSGGGFAGVRTFAQQVKHLAANNYRMAAYILDRAASPEQEDETGPEATRSKSEIIEYLRGSFAALHSAVATINEDTMIEPLASHRPPRQNTRLQFAVDAVAHSYDHYGQMVEYLRMNGVVPPASRKTK
jgi:uncharacterized damage-inducible protein DinB